MADLSALSNKQLREKCLEYGLPNVPVTDSSRSILIKRLNAIMSGKAPTKPAQKKVTQAPISRRKTVAAAPSPVISDFDVDEMEITTSNVDRRRTMQAATPPKNTFGTSRNSTASTSPSKSYSQHIIPIEIEGRATSTKINNANGPHQRRSISLSKTGILTTSYNSETIPLHRAYEENANDVEEDEDEVDEAEEMEIIPDKQSNYNPNQNNYTSQSTYSTSNYTQSKYSPPSYRTSTNFTTHTMPPPPEPSKPKLYPNLQGAGLQNDYYNSLDDILASHSSSARQSQNLGFIYNQPTSYVPSSQTTTTGYVPLSQPTTTGYSPSSQPTTAGGYYPSSSILSNNERSKISNANYGSRPLSPPMTINKNSSFLNSTEKRYSTEGPIRRHTGRAIGDDEGAAGSSSDDQYESSRYSSKFARNVGNLSPTIYASPQAAPPVASRYYTPITKRRTTTYATDGVTFSQFWNSLEQKYHIREAILFIMLFIAAVFVYVFFIQ